MYLGEGGEVDSTAQEGGDEGVAGAEGAGAEGLQQAEQRRHVEGVVELNLPHQGYIVPNQGV